MRLEFGSEGGIRLDRTQIAWRPKIAAFDADGKAHIF
jgi:hypothetical protein